MRGIVKRTTKGGEVRYYVRYIDSDGKRKMRLAPGDLDDAKRKLRKAETNVDRGEMGVPETTDEQRQRRTITVRELSARFLGDVEGAPSYASPKLKDLGNYRLEARSLHSVRILPVLGDKVAATVTALDVEQLRDGEKVSGRAPASVVQTLAALSKLFTWARKVGLVDCDNPVRGIERPPVTASIDYLSHDEIVQLLAHVEEHAPAMRPLLATGLYCGLRKGELFGLRWRDVALEGAPRLDVMRSYRKLPKSGKPRHVAMPPKLAPILTAWKKLCPKTDEGLVFPVADERRGGWRMGRTGEMLELPELLTAAACHVPTKPWHALRHTFASHFMMSGGGLLTLQKILGHSDIHQTLVYAHLAPDFMATEMARLDYTPRPANVADLASRRAAR